MGDESVPEGLLGALGRTRDACVELGQGLSRLAQGVKVTFVTSVLAASMSLVAAAAGCGGGGDGRETLSPAEFRAQADAICADFFKRIDALEEPSSLDEWADYAGQAIPIIDEGHEELRRLVPPDELAGKWSHALDVNDESLQLIRDLRAAAEEGDQERAQDLVEQVQSKDAETGRLAREIGLEECG